MLRKAGSKSRLPLKKDHQRPQILAGLLRSFRESDGKEIRGAANYDGMGEIIGNENGTSYESGMWDLSKKRNIMSTHKTHVSSQTDIKGRAEESDFLVA